VKPDPDFSYIIIRAMAPDFSQVIARGLYPEASQLGRALKNNQRNPDFRPAKSAVSAKLQGIAW